jgi:capping protein beta
VRARRSPWSNEYQPPVEAAADDEEEAFAPEGKLREMEVLANELFAAYRRQYYGADHSVTSVYLWDVDGGGFAGCWLLKKRSCFHG